MNTSQETCLTVRLTPSVERVRRGKNHVLPWFFVLIYKAPAFSEEGRSFYNKRSDDS